MKKKIMELITKSDYQPVDAKGLALKLNINSAKDTQELFKSLATLETDGLIARNRKDKFNTVERLGFIKGKMDLKRAGYGFIIVEGDTKAPDVFIPRDKILDAMDNDLCLVRITKRSENNRFEGAIVTVLKRALEYVVGEYYQGAIFPKNDDKEILFKVKPQNRKGLLDHTIVKAKIIHYSPMRILDCLVMEIIGDANTPGIEILEAVATYGLETEFPEAVKAEVKLIPQQVIKEEYQGRTDLREEIIFTIDGDDTKDIDDAISLQLKANGNYELGVHIADVSHYVQEGTELDKNALRRGTSVYLADRVIPMLPRELSNGICSLNPQVDRLAISCIMEIDKNGNFISHKIIPSVIKSRYQMTYGKVNKIIAADLETSKQYADIVPKIMMMQQLAKILYRVRTEMGSINFETIEPKLVFGNEGQVIDIVIKDRGIAENIIEEFMLAANQTIANHFMKAKLPFIYRVHETPDAEKLATLFKFAKEIGYQLKIPKAIKPQDLQKLLTDVEGTTFEKVINMMMLRSMAKARYSEENFGHYGLAFADYTHFTSPIRRYPDTIVHRLIRTYLFENRIDGNTITHFQTILPDISLETSKAERTAMLCEREIMDMKKAEYMAPLQGHVFDGVVSTLTKFGMFVELPNTVEGLIHISSFSEAIDFNEEKMLYLGISSRKVYTIGMVVKVKLIGVDVLKGRIDFVLV
ncbi:MAG: ribonuclease R [Candidatus Izemoplasmatales bacterium]|jgi:ribonuclease R